jgi:hypothetical protein
MTSDVDHAANGRMAMFGLFATERSEITHRFVRTVTDGALNVARECVAATSLAVPWSEVLSQPNGLAFTCFWRSGTSYPDDPTPNKGRPAALPETHQQGQMLPAPM